MTRRQVLRPMIHICTKFHPNHLNLSRVVSNKTNISPNLSHPYTTGEKNRYIYIYTYIYIYKYIYNLEVVCLKSSITKIQKVLQNLGPRFVEKTRCLGSILLLRMSIYRLPGKGGKTICSSNWLQAWRRIWKNALTTKIPKQPWFHSDFFRIGDHSHWPLWFLCLNSKCLAWKYQQDSNPQQDGRSKRIPSVTFDWKTEVPLWAQDTHTGKWWK